IWPTLSDTALLRLAHQLVEAIQRLLQSPVCDNAAQTGHGQNQQQQQYKNTERNLDQRKRPKPFHRRSYSIDAKSQQALRLNRRAYYRAHRSIQSFGSTSWSRRSTREIYQLAPHRVYSSLSSRPAIQ